MDALSSEDKLMPHLHLSIQHGNDLILKRMKRRHLARDVERFVEQARKNRPGIVIGADLISGFPTETKEAHKSSLRLIRNLEICWGIFSLLVQELGHQLQKCHKSMSRLGRKEQKSLE